MSKYPQSIDVVDIIKSATLLYCMLTNDKEMCRLAPYDLSTEYEMNKHPEIEEFSKTKNKNVKDVLLRFWYFALLQADESIHTAEDASQQLTWARLQIEVSQVKRLHS